MDLTYHEAGHSLYARSGISSGSGDSRPAVYKVIGIILALSSGLFIGISFVLKKKGLLRANEKYNEVAGEGYGYLRNWMWWTGMTLMIIGEVCNFVAYAFVDAILVTPMGALSVVVTAILSAIFLKERLSFVGKVGCFLCIVGSVIIVINAPDQSAVATIQDMKKLVIAPGFLSYAGVVIVGCIAVAIWVAPRWGKKTMMVYIGICSMIGGLSVVATQGLGAAIVAQIGGTPQFNQWFLYVLFVFVVATLLTEIIYLNKALNLFNAALVTPTYYVVFTSSTIVTSAILFQGFKGTAATISTVIMGFLVICAGVILLQLSKSAKDVPDAAVFKGDLDQVRTVAEQEEPEYEPRADTLRGSASIIRTFSQARQRREATEAKTLHSEYLRPIGEFESIEWDGLRRRRTVVSSGSGQHSMERRKTVHPPLGMSQIPAADSDDGTDSENEVHPGFLSRLSMRKKRPASLPHHSSTHPVPLESISVGVKSEDSEVPPVPPLPHKTSTQDFAAHDGSDSPHVYGLPPGLRDEPDTAYHSLRPSGGQLHWSSNTPTSKSPNLEPPRPPPHAINPSAGGGKRQFSFQNPFSRHSDNARPISPPERPMSARSGLSFSGRNFITLGHHKRGHSGGASGAGSGAAAAAAASATEEERLGLVKGDSQTFLDSHLGGGHGRSDSSDLEPLDENDDSYDFSDALQQQSPPGYSIAGAGFAAAPRDIRVPAPGVPAGALHGASGSSSSSFGGGGGADSPKAYGAVRKVDTDDGDFFGGGGDAGSSEKGKF